jgi:hypothetical protein
MNGRTDDGRKIARLLLSLVIVGSAAAIIGFTWNESLVFNPGWHPHARFHAAQIVGIVAAASPLGLWLVWRRAVEPGVTFPLLAALRRASHFVGERSVGQRFGEMHA